MDNPPGGNPAGQAAARVMNVQEFPEVLDRLSGHLGSQDGPVQHPGSTMESLGSQFHLPGRFINVNNGPLSTARCNPLWKSGTLTILTDW